MSRLLMLVPAAVLSAASASAQGGEDPKPLTERERASHILNRLAFGPRPGEIENILQIGIDAWLD